MTKLELIKRNIKLMEEAKSEAYERGLHAEFIENLNHYIDGFTPWMWPVRWVKKLLKGAKG